MEIHTCYISVYHFESHTIMSNGSRFIFLNVNPGLYTKYKPTHPNENIWARNLIGASLSEPHTYQVAGKFALYILYIIAYYVCMVRIP